MNERTKDFNDLSRRTEVSTIDLMKLPTPSLSVRDDLSFLAIIFLRRSNQISCINYTSFLSKNISKTNRGKFYSHSLRLRVVDAQGSVLYVDYGFECTDHFQLRNHAHGTNFFGVWMAALLRPKAQVASVVVPVFETERSFQSQKD